MTPKEALKELYRQVGSIHYFDFSDELPRETLTLLRKSGLFEIIEKSLNRLEELERVLKFIKDHVLLDGSVLKANFQWDLDCEENGELLKEYFK